MSGLADHFREQSAWCERLGSPFTARLLEFAADDLERDGIVARLTRDWAGNPRSDALALRIAGAVHASALSERDLQLAGLYPAPGRNWDMASVGPAAMAFLEREAEWVRGFMRSPPQTNEVGRAGVLAPAFMWLAGRAPQPLHMLELGASAGLNLNWDAFRYAHGAWGRNDGDGPLIPTEYVEAPPAWREIEIASRRACDRAPPDLGDEDARLRLRSYVWADQFDRLERLDAAVGLARRAPWRVDPAKADAWLAEKLAGALPVGTSVVYHSVFLQYPDEAARAAIGRTMARAGAAASAERQLAWLRFEPEAVLGGPTDSKRFVINAVLWAGGAREEFALGEADPHGWRVQWVGDRAVS